MLAAALASAFGSRLREAGPLDALVRSVSREANAA
jgi:hypothetical protein